MRQIDVDRIISLSLPALQGFAALEPRSWGREGTLLELCTEIGSLGRVLTIWENYRRGPRSRHALGDELSDILFVLVKLQRDEGVTISPLLYTTYIGSAEQSFFRLLELATAMLHSSRCQTAHIEEMISIIGGIGDHYGISIEEAHQQEMALALQWQRLLYTSQGNRRRAFLLRKIRMRISLHLHRRRMDRGAIAYTKINGRCPRFS